MEEMVEIQLKIWRDLTRSGNQLLGTAKTQNQKKKVMVAVEIDGGDRRNVWRGGGADRRDVWRGGGGDRCVCGGVAVLRLGGEAVLRHGSMEGLAAWQLGRRCGLVAWRFGWRGKGERNERERE